MRLSELLRAIPPPLDTPATPPAEDPPIRGICMDSRRVSPGDLFVALPGTRTDGHDHIPEAVRLGAAALLVERVPGGVPGSCPVVVVPDTRRVLAPISAHFYGTPSHHLSLIGITGTNGKTSTSYLVESILSRAGRRVGLIGTVEVRYGEVRQRTLNTTPESLELQQVLRRMVDHGIDAVAMEVSSHGVALGRIEGCAFQVAALTNVTQDHLDFHGTMDDYLEAKLELFRRFLAPGSNAVVNADDPAAPSFEAAAKEARARLIRVSRHRRDADVRCESADVSLDGTRARILLPSGPLEVFLPLIGDFNLENMLVAVGIAVTLGTPQDAIVDGVAACSQVPGRVERVVAGQPDAPTVLVDYAHTPDAVDKLLRAVRPLTRGRLVVLFGCGGDRDRSKRALMAQAVARHADRAIATSDNPRTEDPLRILADVERGLQSLRRVEPEQLAGRERSFAMLVDRRRAIDLAVGIAGPEDTVVLAGKGHEDYQIVGHERLPFDDRVEARRALALRGRRS